MTGKRKLSYSGKLFVEKAKSISRYESNVKW